MFVFSQMSRLVAPSMLLSLARPFPKKGFGSMRPDPAIGRSTLWGSPMAGKPLQGKMGTGLYLPSMGNIEAREGKTKIFYVDGIVVGSLAGQGKSRAGLFGPKTVTGVHRCGRPVQSQIPFKCFWD